MTRVIRGNDTFYTLYTRHYWREFGSDDAALTNGKLPRVASRGREKSDVSRMYPTKNCLG